METVKRIARIHAKPAWRRQAATRPHPSGRGQFAFLLAIAFATRRTRVKILSNRKQAWLTEGFADRGLKLERERSSRYIPREPYLQDAMPQLTTPADEAAASALESARRVLSTEIGGLEALAAAFLGDMAAPFERAVETLSTIRGRVIVTGMGKSGHIGTKIAATFASTGTPAFFVHPAEANHGDLGMIARDDAVLAMSWSGESAELKGILAYSRRFSIPLIAMTANPHSALGREADICLALPRVAEACPHNLAPTTSTIMQLALGDCLAIALLEHRGFSANDFKTFHPGGSLGASLTQISEIMRTGDELPVISGDASVFQAVNEISEKGFGCVVVTDDRGKVAGIITDGDLRRNLERDLSGLKALDIMTADPKMAAPDTFAGTAMSQLNLGPKAITVLVVVDEEERPVGLLRMHDLLRIGVA
jgi:arabinose-5-phosphate isomerase